MSWTPSSWRGHPIRQQPDYANPRSLTEALQRVAGLPPLVHPGEVDALKARLAEASRGERFLLQGGDCAERFEDCARGPIEAKLKILLQMSLVLTWGARLPVVRIGRLAGQYAKPRSKPFEVVEGRQVHSYRGDHVNSYDIGQRVPDPKRLVRAYHHSAATLNYVRALLDGGFADLRHPEHWTLDFVEDHARRGDYEEVVSRLLDTLDFMGAMGADLDDTLRTVELYTSHEGLLLPYEEAQTEAVGERFYNLGAHFLWIGDRTRQLDGAHIEYFRGIANPIGLKCGPSLDPDELVEVMAALDPDDEPGRLTLITRYGADRIDELLPRHVDAVRAAGRTPVWTCDPMHGNTKSTAEGLKTRPFDDILAELSAAARIHRELGSHLGGVHFELTGEAVTECTGGPEALEEKHLPRNYQSFCDPRLNGAQSLEMAFLLAQELGR